MRRNVFLTFVLLLSISICNELFGQVGIGTDNPTNTLHIKPVDPNEDPLRVEDLNQLMQGDSALLIIDPAEGIVRYITMDSLVLYMANHLDLGKDLQDASQVPLEPDIDITNSGNAVNNVQDALEAIRDKMPKGTYKSIGEARIAGLLDGDSFYADPKGVFGCSGCIITLFPGMN